ncbi:MAG: autotransporter-associated beta strand repeat-containing protein [Planctomycetes bacterium]|nr:autotransporter-associated beta strand repeat-containing protein [Planctomycetota bacterium]
MRARSLVSFVAAGLVATALVGVSNAQVLYTENFDDGTAASRWTTSQAGGTSLANFAYDYSTAGIPTAPGGTGSTGLRFDTNTGPTGAISAITAFPNGQNFTGNQTLSFNLWFNVVGTAATTEHGVFGLNHTSTAIQTPTAGSGTIPSVGPSPNGFDYAMSGDAGASRDLRTYANGLEIYGTAAGYARNNLYVQVEDVNPYMFAYQPYLTGTAAMPANQWLNVAVTSYSGTALFQVNGQTWARTPTTSGSGNIMLGYMDLFSSVAGTSIFSVYDNVRVSVAGAPATQLTWTPNGATAGGAGTWSNLGTQWIGTGTTPTTWDWSLPAKFQGTGGTVTIGTQVTSGAGLEFLTNGYTISSGTLILGSYDPGTGVSFNTNAIAQVTVAAGASARIESLIRGTRGVTKLGQGTLVLANANTVSGTSVVQAGTLRLGNQMALAQSPVSVVPGGTLEIDPALGMISTRLILNGGTVSAAGATLTVDRDIGVRQFIVNAGNLAGTPALEVTLGGTMIMSGSAFNGVSVGSLVVDESATGGRVDLGCGRIDVASGGITAANLVADILAGRDGNPAAVWTGSTGITSSVAAAAMAAGTSPRAVGWIDDGSGALSVAFAAQGDTNIDGQIDILDVANFLSSGKFDSGELAVWSQGDFGYDGMVDILDVADFLGTGLFDAGNYLPAPAGTGAIAAVPEPASTAAAGIVSLAVAWRLARRRCVLTGTTSGRS